MNKKQIMCISRTTNITIGANTPLCLWAFAPKSLSFRKRAIQTLFFIRNVLYKSAATFILNDIHLINTFVASLMIVTI